MKQKFRKLSFVRVIVDSKKNPEMSHFESGFDGIVDGTYSQIYGGPNVKSYSVFQLRSGEIVNRISWYNEDQLSLLSNQDREKAEELIESYNLRVYGRSPN